MTRTQNIFITIGISGSQKSELFDNLSYVYRKINGYKDEEDSLLLKEINTLSILQELYNTSSYTEESRKEVNKYASMKLESLLEKNKDDVFINSCNLTETERKMWTDICYKHDCHIHFIIMTDSFNLQDCKLRYYKEANDKQAYDHMIEYLKEKKKELLSYPIVKTTLTLKENICDTEYNIFKNIFKFNEYNDLECNPELCKDLCIFTEKIDIKVFRDNHYANFSLNFLKGIYPSL